MNQFSHIVFVNDAKEYNHYAVRQATDLARINQAQLTFIWCFSSLKKLSKNQPKQNILIEEMLEFKRAELEQNLKQYTGVINIEIKVLLGNPTIDIIREVIDSKVDLLIKSVEKSGFKHILFDSLDLKLLRQCPCPVWLIKMAEKDADKKILVAIDCDIENPENAPLNVKLLEMAAYFAIDRSAELHVVHVWNFENEKFLRSVSVDYKTEDIDSLIQAARKNRHNWLKETVAACWANLEQSSRRSLMTKLHLLDGYATFKIPELAENIGAELLVMGTLGRTGIQGFLIGNTAENILFNVDCSVLALKPDGFVSPIKPT